MSLPEVRQAHLHYRLEAIMEEMVKTSVIKDEIIMELIELLK